MSEIHPDSPGQILPDQKAILDYIGDMSLELALIARRSGLDVIAEDLQATATRARDELKAHR